MIPDQILGAKGPVSKPYFRYFEDRKQPAAFRKLSRWEEITWHIFAGLTIGLGANYLAWRWLHSLNPEAMNFSILVAGAETAMFFGTLLFFFDIWSERDTPIRATPRTRGEASLDGNGAIQVDVLITTINEGADIVRESILDAQNLKALPGVKINVKVLDDGLQHNVREACSDLNVEYLARGENHGYKAGNLRNALLKTNGDFFIICDADTRLFPDFVANTLGYFRDPNVSWVQTPHWFYDTPGSHGKPDKQQKFSKLLGPFNSRASTKWDPFLTDPTVFFDIIQRRRNRNNASFCCGAGSIHRSEAVFDVALSGRASDFARVKRDTQKQALPLLKCIEAQPFRNHVSEDLLTSIGHHQSKWKSIYHPQVEARMLSPWSMDAWATQQFKYAGGTFDIILRENPIFRSGLNFRQKLHYFATFWSYLSVLWVPILVFAPVFSLFTGIAPIESISMEFFILFLPVVIANELALFFGCKGYNTHIGRAATICCAGLQLRALWQVLLGDRPKFPATPKKPGNGRDWRHVKPAFAVLGFFVIAGFWGGVSTFFGRPGYSFGLLIVNYFWLTWTASALIHLIRMGAWSATEELCEIRTAEQRKLK